MKYKYYRSGLQVYRWKTDKTFPLDDITEDVFEVETYLNDVWKRVGKDAIVYFLNDAYHIPIERLCKQWRVQYIFTQEYDEDWQWAEDYDFVRFENITIDQLKIHPDFEITEKDVKENTPRVRPRTIRYYLNTTHEMKPLIVNSNYNLLDGHHRLYALKKKKQNDIQVAIVKERPNVSLKSRNPEWWRAYTYEQQKKYLEEHLNSKLKLTKIPTKHEKSLEGTEFEHLLEEPDFIKLMQYLDSDDFEDNEYSGKHKHSIATKLYDLGMTASDVQQYLPDVFETIFKTSVSIEGEYLYHGTSIDRCMEIFQDEELGRENRIVYLADTIDIASDYGECIIVIDSSDLDDDLYIDPDPYDTHDGWGDAERDTGQYFFDNSIYIDPSKMKLFVFMNAEYAKSMGYDINEQGYVELIGDQVKKMLFGDDEE